MFINIFRKLFEFKNERRTVSQKISNFKREWLSYSNYMRIIYRLLMNYLEANSLMMIKLYVNPIILPQASPNNRNLKDWFKIHFLKKNQLTNKIPFQLHTKDYYCMIFKIYFLQLSAWIWLGIWYPISPHERLAIYRLE
jgi:hypothetical protein